MRFIVHFVILMLSLMMDACGNKTNFETNEKKREIKSERGSQGDGDAEKGELDAVVAEATIIAPVDPVAEANTIELTGEVVPEQPTRVEKVFISAPSKSMSLTFNQEYLELVHELKRVRGFVGQKDSFDQIDRPQTSATFKQGTIGKLVTENFNQDNLGIIDILAVVDNSGSMKGEQIKVSKQLPELIKEVAGSNWQIRVVSTDSGQKCSQFPIIKRNNNNNPALEFETTILGLGVNGSGNERGILKAHVGIECPEDPWLREASNLVVLIVSDEDNCSDGNCGSSTDPRDKPETLKTLIGSKIGNTTRVLGNDARIYGLFRQPGVECVGARPAKVYDDLVKDSKGFSGLICDKTYTATFKKISQDMRKQLKSTFQLTNVPEPGSLVVTADDVVLVLDVDYKLSNDTLEFINVPVANAKIKAVYRVNSVPKFKEVDLASDPGKIEMVKIVLPNGDMVELAEDKYTLEGRKIKFKEEPADNANITVAYRENVPLLTEFSIDPTTKDGTIKVMIDQAEVGFSYVDKSGQLVLDEAPLDKAVIEVSYEIPYVGEVINKVDANVDPASISNLSAFNETAQESINVAIVNGSFEFPEGLVEGHKIRLRYRLFGLTDSLAYELPFEPIEGSLTADLVDSDGVKSECAKDAIGVEAQKVHLNCNIENLDLLTVKFDYNLTGDQDFSTGVLEPEVGVWQVFVDGLETKDYKRAGAVISLKGLPTSAEVRILFEHSTPSDLD